MSLPVLVPLVPACFCGESSVDSVLRCVRLVLQRDPLSLSECRSVLCVLSVAAGGRLLRHQPAVPDVTWSHRRRHKGYSNVKDLPLNQ